LAFGIA